MVVNSLRRHITIQNWLWQIISENKENYDCEFEIFWKVLCTTLFVGNVLSKWKKNLYFLLGLLQEEEQRAAMEDKNTAYEPENNGELYWGMDQLMSGNKTRTFLLKYLW